MHTVREVSDRYGVTTRFLTLALEKIGYHAAEPDQPLSAATIARLESAYGEKIRARRPAPEPDAQQAPAVRKPKPHVMRVAHEHHTGKKRDGYFVKVLLDDPGTLHAIDAEGAREGDPWLRSTGPSASWRGDPGSARFFEHQGPHAACGARVKVVLRDEFVPADTDDPARADQCPKCVALVASGKGFRTPPHEREHRSYFCEAYLRVRVDGAVEVQDCSLRDDHRGPHRTRDGATWDIGFDDFVPAPLDAARRITKAS